LAEPLKAGVEGVECELCQLVVKYAKDKLGNNNTEVGGGFFNTRVNQPTLWAWPCMYRGVHKG